MNGIIFCVCLTLAISVLQSVLKWCRKECRKIQVKKESQQNRNQWWIWSRDAAKGLLSCYFLLHQNARWKPDTKVNILWACKLRSTIERWDLLYTLSRRVIQSGSLIKLDLLKSGNLMTLWKEWESSQEWSLRNSRQCWNCTILRFIRRKPDLSIEQNLRLKNFEARNGNVETSAVVKNQRVKQHEQRSLGDCWQWNANGQCSKGDSCSFRHDKDKRAKSTQPNPSPRSSAQQNKRNASRSKSPRGRSPSGKMARLPCKDHLKGTCTNSFCGKKASSRMLALQVRKWMQILVISALTHTARLTNSPAWSKKKNGDKIAVAILKSTRQLGCVFQDMEPPKSSSILRESSDTREPIRCVRFTIAMLRHANIRDQKPSHGIICPGDPHNRNPNAPKFEDRSSKEETERQERDAREAAWKMARCILNLKEKHKTTFFSPSENWCLPSPSTIKPEEREFVVDSGASMHMISKKDLNSAELETVTTSRSPTIVITANGEVQTNEEATVYIRELYIFLTMKLLEDTPAVPTLAKLCDEHGYSYEWINGQNHISLKMVFEYSTIRKTSYQSWFLVFLQLPRARLFHELIFLISIRFRVKWKCGQTSTERPVLFWNIRRVVTWTNQNPKTQKKEDHETGTEKPYSDIPERLQEFRKNLVDERVPEHRDSHASSSHEPSLEPMRSVDLGKHSIYTHVPKDRNCEIQNYKGSMQKTQ